MYPVSVRGLLDLRVGSNLSLPFSFGSHPCASTSTISNPISEPRNAQTKQLLGLACASCALSWSLTSLGCYQTAGIPPQSRQMDRLSSLLTPFGFCSGIQMNPKQLAWIFGMQCSSNCTLPCKPLCCSHNCAVRICREKK